MSISTDEAEEEGTMAMQMVRNCTAAAQQSRKKSKIDHRTLPRNPKRQFRHEEALHCINRDYMGIPGDSSTPLCPGREFATMF